MSCKKNKKLRDAFRFYYLLDPTTGEILEKNPKTYQLRGTGKFRDKTFVKSLYKEYISMLGV